MGIQRHTIGACFGELNHAAAFQVVGIVAVFHRLTKLRIDEGMACLAAGFIFRFQRQNQFSNSTCTDPCSAVFASVSVTAYANREGHAVSPDAVALVSADFLQGIGAGNQIFVLTPVGSVIIAGQISVCIRHDIGNIGGFGSIGAGIDVKYHTCQLLVSIRSYAGSQIGSGFAQIDEAVHHAVGGNGFGSGKGRTVHVIVLIGHNVGAVGVICDSFPVDLGLHRAVGDLLSIRGVFRQITPGMRLGSIRIGCGKGLHRSRNICPIVASRNLLLKLEGCGKPTIRLLGIVGILPCLFHRIALQFDVGEGVLCVVGHRGIPGREEADKRCEQGCVLRFVRVFRCNLRLVPCHRMLHHFVDQLVAVPVTLGKLRPSDTLVFRCRFQRFRQALITHAMAQIAGIGECPSVIAMPDGLILGFVQQFKGRGGSLAILMVPDFVRRNGGITCFLHDQLVGDFTFVPGEGRIIEMVIGFKGIVCPILIVLGPHWLFAENLIAIRIHTIIRVYLDSTEIQGIVGSSILANHCHRKILQRLLPVLRLRDGKGIVATILLNIHPIGKLEFTFRTATLSGSAAFL